MKFPLEFKKFYKTSIVVVFGKFQKKYGMFPDDSSNLCLLKTHPKRMPRNVFLRRETFFFMVAKKNKQTNYKFVTRAARDKSTAHHGTNALSHTCAQRKTTVTRS